MAEKPVSHEEALEEIRRLLSNRATIFTEDEIADIREVVQFAMRLKWMLSALGQAAKWLSIVSGGFMVLSQMGILKW